MGARPTISVIIPTLDAGHTLRELLDALRAQDLPPDEVVVVDSSSSDDTLQIARAGGARTLVVERALFDHGGTRHDALLHTTGDVVCFINQDAVPRDATLLSALVAPLAEPDVAASFARQLPVPGARRYAELVQGFNYPPTSHVSSEADARERGMDAIFLSDVCAAYRRRDYLEVGGFERPIPTNEDMLMCARLLRAHKRVAYVAEARVRHSNVLTLRQQFCRDAAIGAFLYRYAAELDFGSPSRKAGELNKGMRLTRAVCATLLREGCLGELARFGAYCIVRLAGNRWGRMRATRTHAKGTATPVPPAEEPTVHILMATHDGERFLAEQIESVLAQNYGNWCLLVSDDCSKDDTLGIVRRYAKADGRIRVVSEAQRHGGAAANFLWLLRHTDAPYAMLCDQDDVWLPHKVRRTMEAMRALEGECGGPHVPLLVFSDLRVVDERLRPLSASFERYAHIDPARTGFAQVLAQSVGAGNTMMANRALLDLVALTPPAQPMIMHDWWMTLVAAGFGRMGHIGEPTALYRQHDGNADGASRFSLAWWLSRPHEARRRFARTVRQAASFGEVYGSMLLADKADALERFARIGVEERAWARVADLVGSGAWKRGLRKAGQLLGALWWLDVKECES